MRTFILVITLLLSFIACESQAEAPRPNILFIFADDWGWQDLSCHDHPYIKTPNIDRLAKEGTDFHRFTVASGVCSPSRTAVMTGHFPARYGIDGHFAWVNSNARRNMPDWLDPKAPLLSRMLQNAGYRTGHFGKWHLANDMIPDSPLPSQYGFDDYGAFNCAGEQMPVHDDAKRAIAFIERCKAEGKPWFINLWVHEPHTPFHTVKAWRDRFPDLPERDNIYASVLAHADARIGQVLDTLDRLKIADNTLVIFSSDNGPARGRPNTPLKEMFDTATGKGYNIAAAKGLTGGRKGYKGALFEGGISVPFIARWPGKIAAGKVDKRSIFSAVDLLPTFCELAGAKLPENYKPDGVSQVNTLLGKGSELRNKPLFWKMSGQNQPSKNRPHHWVAWTVVSGRHKLMTSRDGSYVKLYDLVADPLEQHELSESKPEVLKQLRSELAEWRKTLPAKPTGEVFSKFRGTKTGDPPKRN